MITAAGASTGRMGGLLVGVFVARLEKTNVVMTPNNLVRYFTQVVDPGKLDRSHGRCPAVAA